KTPMQNILENLKISPKIRGEQLCLAEIGRLADAVDNYYNHRIQ
ncbi:MAG: 16S rRNA (adenine(1518)-N(6)/adenine(1519)-N(6))-dimethyltransferase, partial [Candidatus Omnitrophota bacterium]